MIDYLHGENCARSVHQDAVGVASHQHLPTAGGVGSDDAQLGFDFLRAAGVGP
jgi:hypothetical protein